MYCDAIQIRGIIQKYYIRQQVNGCRQIFFWGGIISLWGLDVVAKPYNTGQSPCKFLDATMQMGFTNIRPDEMVMGLTMEDILSIVN